MARGVLCPQCGNIASSSAASCPRCGATLDVDDNEDTAVRPRHDATVRSPPVSFDDASGTLDGGTLDEDTSGARTKRFETYTEPAARASKTVTDGTPVSTPRPPAAAPRKRLTTGERRLSAPSTEPVGRVQITRGGAATQPLAEASVEVSASLDLVGKRLGEYVVEERIGMGGMGAVYRARHPLIGTSVAIKVLRSDVMVDKRDLQRFLDEARVVNSIKHRGIINIFNAGELDDGRQYLVMEHLQGESLETRLDRQGKLPLKEALPILEEVASALAAAHGAGVVHRDLKPANVFLVPESGGKTWVKLLDFGLARRTNQELSRIAGTPDYISPEHARGRPAGPPSDMYGLGVLSFHVLTGRLPFLGTTPMQVMEQHVHHQAPRTNEVEKSVPAPVSDFILELMAKSPGDRPTAKEAVERLGALAATAMTAPTPSTTDSGAEGEETLGQDVRTTDHAALAAAAAAKPGGPPWLLIIAAVAVLLLAATAGWVFLS
ncbi:MAG: protein kinase [Myxococcaceae bacterium]|nr:protein kinase [Myxococcaceae bacterium]